MKVTLNRHGENDRGNHVWTTGKYHVERRQWVLPYASTSYLLSDTTNGKRLGDFDRLSDIRDYIADARTNAVNER